MIKLTMMTSMNLSKNYLLTNNLNFNYYDPI